MKKVLKCILPVAILATMFFMVGCGGDDAAGDATVRIALVTDYGTIDDGSFNQGSWEGVLMFAQANNLPSDAYWFHQPVEISDAAYLDSIEQVIVMGRADIVVTPGFLFSAAIYQAQDLFPDTKFVLLDAAPNPGGGGAVRIENNVVSVMYAEEQSGFLAGYAAVMDGYRSLGFVGGIPVPAVVRFGHGFVQGAEHAAQSLGLAPGAVTINYHYAGTFSPQPEIQTLAASWYAGGVELIFAAAGGAGFSVIAAAEANDGFVIGVDRDQAGDSDRVITSALKSLQGSVNSVIADFVNDSFPGGQQVIFDASGDGVGLPMATSRFNQFTQAQYNAVFAQLVSGAVRVDARHDIAVTELNTPLVSVTLIG